MLVDKLVVFGQIIHYLNHGDILKNINDKFLLRAEKDDIAGLSERRLEEIERLHSKIRELTEEVNRAVSAKCEAVSRLEDLDTKESNLQFKERRFIEEKNFLESQIEMLKVNYNPISCDAISRK